MTESAFYAGRVRHTRLEPFHHQFEYRVYYGLFDIDELTALGRRLHFFSFDRFNLFSLRSSDHGPMDGSPLRPWVERTLGDFGVDIEGGPIRLLCFPRVLGYAFNPISVWYCHGPDGELRAVMHEVRNTFGDSHLYVVPCEGGDLGHDFDKQLHVSPFNPVDQHYQFSMTIPSEHLSISITQTDDNGRMFTAGLRLSRVAMTDMSLIRLFFTHPLLTLKVIGAIHWQALKLRLKGGTYHRRPVSGSDRVTYAGRAHIPT